MAKYPITLEASVEIPDPPSDVVDEAARTQANAAYEEAVAAGQRVAGVAQDVAQMAARLENVAVDGSEVLARVTTLESRLGVVEVRPDDDVDDEARARIDALEARPPAGGGTSVRDPRVFFEDFGTSDSARVGGVIAWLASRGPTTPTPEIQMPARRVQWDQQLPTESGGRFLGTITAAREFNTGCVIDYVGASPSFFKLQAEPGKYSYPGGGVSRDMHFHGIQFNGGNDKDFLPPAPSTAFDGSYVQWYWDFTNCGFVGWDNFVSGWGTGLTMNGITHFQAADESIRLGGSECDWFTAGSLLDSGNLAGDKPALDWSASKSTIGAAMLSARGDSYQLRVTYGHNTTCIGTKFDSPDSAPIKGHNVRFTGGTDFGFSGCSFKGGRGILATAGSAEIEVENCGFNGSRELARLEAGFNGVLLWGLNRYGDAPRTIFAARASQVVCLDPRVTVRSLDGATVLKPASV